jgi:hypothetical protein
MSETIPDELSREEAERMLKQANVLKIRGQREEAREMCLAILRRRPDDPEPYALLGDLYADDKDWAQASQWYELAVDLNPEGRAEAAKLEWARQFAQETTQLDEETARAEQQAKWLPMAVLAVSILSLLMASVALWQSNRGAVALAETPAVVAPMVQDSNSGANGGAPPSGEADTIRTQVQALVEGSAQVKSIWLDPRTGVAYASARTDGPDPRRDLAEVAEAVLKATDAVRVTVRIESSGTAQTMVADVDRTDTVAADAANLGPGSLERSEAILKNEYPPRPVGTTPSP